MKKKILLCFSFLSVFLVNSIGQQSLSLYANKCQNFKIGTAVGSNFYNVYDTGDLYNQTITTNFNILVAENEMKYDAMEPQKGIFSFTKPDKLVAYAQKYGIQIRGHNLCWHNQLPSWLNAGLTNGTANGTFTRSSLLALLKNHITTIVSRYKGKIQQWDVVNEPFNDGTGTLRSSIWQQVIGNDYIDSAFVWAHRADPDAKLYLNEYGIEIYGGTKSNAMYTYVTAMKNRNIPINGVGFQCHFTVSKIDFTKLDQNIKRYAAVGLEAIITELDIRIAITDYTANPTKWLASQAEDYRQMIRTCLNNSNSKTFLTWGFTDKYSWIPSFTTSTGNGPASDYALIFDTSFNPKPAYTSILNELISESIKSETVNINQDKIIKLILSKESAEIQTLNKLCGCQLFNIQGKCLFNIRINANSVIIPLADIQQGIYILKIQFENGQLISRKFVI